MIVTVVIASIIVGVGVVGIRRLIMENIFIGRVNVQLTETRNNIRESRSNLPILEEGIRALALSEDLMAARFSEEQETLRVIPDSLPSVDNEVALGASLAEGILCADCTEGPITIESIRTGNSAFTTMTPPAIGSGMGVSNFAFTVNGDDNSVKEVLENLERSIRFMTVGQMNIMRAGRTQLSVSGGAFYVNEVTVQLTSTVIRMGDN
jgi:hypothetical protein